MRDCPPGVEGSTVTQIRFLCESCGATVVFDPETAKAGSVGVMATCNCGTVYRLAAGVVTSVSAMEARRQPWIRVHRHDDVARIEAGGDLDFGTRDSIHEAVTDALAEPVPRELVVDLRGVTFIDTLTMHAAVIVATQAAVDAGARPRVLASDIVRRVLDIAGVTEFLDD